MGGVKQRELEDEGRGFWSNRELWVCSDHVQDKDILQHYSDSSAEIGNCSFCEENGNKVLSWDDLMEKIIFPIREVYNHPANGLAFESAEGGYYGNVYNSLELLSDIIGLEVDYEVVEEIANTLVEEEWTEAEFYGPTYSEALNYSWDSFSDLVKYRVRYLFQEIKAEVESYEEIPFRILDDIGSFVNFFKLHFTVQKTTSTIYRSTQFNPENRTVKGCVDIGSAPKQYAGSNRFSAEGISLFYGAEDKFTAIKEILNTKRKDDLISIGLFVPNRDLTLIDLRQIPRIGFFNFDKYKYRQQAKFLEIFIENVTKKINVAHRSSIEYVPSQIVTEYFRFIYSKKYGMEINGIVYKSAQNPTKDCFVIFADSENCRDEGFEDEGTVMVLRKDSLETIGVSDI